MSRNEANPAGRPRPWPILLLLWLAAPAGAAPKTDVLVFRNGDHLTGEVKSLDRGKLRFDTNATGTIDIEWKDVARLVSTQDFQVETESGTVYFGKLAEPEAAGTVQIAREGEPAILPTGQVVRLTPIEGTLLSRLDGDISAGYSLASANNQTQFAFALNMEYQTERLLTVLDADSSVTNSTNNEENRRGAVGVQTYRLLQDRWFTGVVAKAERNDELGINMRWSAGGGGGRFLKQTNSQVWRATAGLLYTDENYNETTGSNTSIEGYMGLHFDWFRFDEPELDLSSSLTLIPSLTQSGRWRASYQVDLKWELYHDFFWRLSLLGDYDNKPVDEAASKSDYTLNTSLGWDF